LHQVIVIDPGHGGADPGAIAGGVRESALALAYGLTLAGELARRGVVVRMTRDGDRYPTLAQRAQMANAAGARAFLSVHFNASSSPTAHGPWLIHAKGAPGGTALARVLAGHLRAALHTDDSPSTGGRRLAVLRQTAMPAALIEYGFLTHPGERTLVQSVWHMRQLIEQTADGVAEWIG
jgi:N-acetylmuramoyl-L-alanine amidase